MSVNDTWMPLYLGDYLADTMHLNATQHGAYLLLLMHYWRNGPLPADDAQLAAIARCEMRAWKTVGPVVRGFFRLDGGLLYQKRMDQERNKWSSISDKRREAGKAGAQAKWKPNGSHPPPDPNASRGANADSLPVDKYGKRMALAIEDSVDNYGNRIANATKTDGKCHNFAITPVPSKEDSLLSFKGESLPRETEPERGKPRETGPTAAEVLTVRRADHVRLVDAGAVGDIASTLGSQLGRTVYAPGCSPRLTVQEQLAVATPRPTIKPRHLTREQLAAAGVRRKAFA